MSYKPFVILSNGFPGFQKVSYKAIVIISGVVLSVEPCIHCLRTEELHCQQLCQKFA